MSSQHYPIDRNTCPHVHSTVDNGIVWLNVYCPICGLLLKMFDDYTIHTNPIDVNGSWLYDRLNDTEATDDDL